MKYTEVLIKRANAGSVLAGLASGVAQGFAQLGALGSVLLLAATAAGGVGLGWAASQATAHGKQDIDTNKKEYENERLKADLGYLSAKTKSEYEAFKNKYQPKPARVIA